ncbi:hypothetical protein OPV22_012788 [Ensete ventricosum]|uniref:Uncharacterized protein n=1 Tax=Ensete ventricosum TaxID=4639 RepID=A0AAV8R7T4_ENSVE|nr:hypothetical protein OPV22_012788 [Ensete ventricosum]
MLLHPISTPGHIEEYHGAAGRNPHTFYTSFSNEVLEAVFNTPWDKLERVFRSQRKGEIIKINEDHIRALSESETETTGNECELLQDLNVDVSIGNISERSLMAPNYDTRRRKLMWCS